MGTCCERMQREADQKCVDHADPAECPDRLVAFDSAGTPQGLWIHDGGDRSFQSSGALGVARGFRACPTRERNKTMDPTGLTSTALRVASCAGGSSPRC
jgi:hypothetical protein